MDVVVSVPLTVAIHAAFLSSHNEGARRWTTAGACAMVTAAWLVGFRTGWVLHLPFVAAWVAVLGTLWWPLRRWQTSAWRAIDPEVARVGGSGRDWTLSRSEV